MLGSWAEKGEERAQRKHTPEEIINKLREAEVAIAAGNTVAETSRSIVVSEQTFYRCRAEYGGLRIDQARRLAAGDGERPAQEGGGGWPELYRQPAVQSSSVPRVLVPLRQ